MASNTWPMTRPSWWEAWRGDHDDAFLIRGVDFVLFREPISSLRPRRVRFTVTINQNESTITVRTIPFHRYQPPGSHFLSSVHQPFSNFDEELIFIHLELYPPWCPPRLTVKMVATRCQPFDKRSPTWRIGNHQVRLRWVWMWWQISAHNNVLRCTIRFTECSNFQSIFLFFRSS